MKRLHSYFITVKGKFWVNILAESGSWWRRGKNQRTDFNDEMPHWRVGWIELTPNFPDHRATCRVVAASMISSRPSEVRGMWREILVPGGRTDNGSLWLMQYLYPVQIAGGEKFFMHLFVFIWKRVCWLIHHKECICVGFLLEESLVDVSSYFAPTEGRVSSPASALLIIKQRLGNTHRSRRCLGDEIIKKSTTICLMSKWRTQKPLVLFTVTRRGKLARGMMNW